MAETRRSALGDRLDEVHRERGLNDHSWSLLAKLSDKYLATQRSRAADKEAQGGTFTLPEGWRAQALARVARVRVEWLRFGTGPRDADAPPSGAVGTLAPAQELALFDVLARGSGFSGEDGVAARTVAGAMAASLPREREPAVKVMEQLLVAVASLRREGGPVTVEAIAVKLLSGGVGPSESAAKEGGSGMLAPAGIPSQAAAAPTKRKRKSA